MPHKHKRKRDDDTSNFDLAPNTRAKPLTPYTKATLFTSSPDGSDKKRRKSNNSAKKAKDDTPKAFARLMSWQATGKRPNGLDDGTAKSKPKSKSKATSTKKEIPKSPPQAISTSAPAKTSTTSTATTTTTTNKTQPTHPKILPGESLSEFSLRVDQTLPLTSIPRSTNSSTPTQLPADLQATLKKSQRTTKHNRRLQRMQSDWRATEAKLRDKEAEDMEDMDERREEEDLLWSSVRPRRRKNKPKPEDADDDDPWKELAKKRGEARQKNLQDVVKAPPTLKKVTSKFRVREDDFDALDHRGDKSGDALVDVGDVPNAVGSLRRREELNRTRRAVIEGYRKMQRRKRGVDERISLSRPVMTS